jgi:hypothetical protein
MDKVIAYFVYLFTPEASVRYMPRGLTHEPIQETTEFRVLIKAVFWMFMSILLPFVIACLH